MIYPYQIKIRTNTGRLQHYEMESNQRRAVKTANKLIRMDCMTHVTIIYCPQSLNVPIRDYMKRPNGKVHRWKCPIM